MNAPRHDPDELKAALEAYAAAERRAADLEHQREQLQREIFRHGSVLSTARERAGKLLAREGGSVIHGDEFWKVEEGRIRHEPVRVNLDAIEEVRKHHETKLTLTPPDSEAA